MVSTMGTMDTMDTHKYLAVSPLQASLIMDTFKATLPTIGEASKQQVEARDLVLRAASLVLEFDAEDAVSAARHLVSTEMAQLKHIEQKATSHGPAATTGD